VPLSVHFDGGVERERKAGKLFMLRKHSYLKEKCPK
jgi:hypothetical protein